MEGLFPFVYRIIVNNPAQDFYSTVPNNSGRFGSATVTPRALVADETPVHQRPKPSSSPAPVSGAAPEPVAEAAPPSSLAKSPFKGVRVGPVGCSHAQPLLMATHVKAN